MTLGGVQAKFYMLEPSEKNYPLGRGSVFQLTFKSVGESDYRVSQKKRSLRISKPLGPTDASGDISVGKGCWGDVG